MGLLAGGCLLVASAFEIDDQPGPPHPKLETPAMNAPRRRMIATGCHALRKRLPFGPTNGAAGTTPLEGPGSARCSRSTRPDAADAEIAM